MAAEVEAAERRADGVVARVGLWGWLRRGEWVRWFVRSAGVLLLLTGLAKLWSAMGEARVLGVRDPLFGLTFEQLMLGVGLVEVVVAWVCLVGRRERLSLVLVGWLSGNFALYRLGLWWLGWKGPCGCLGHVTDALGVSPTAADLVMKIVLGYLLVGALAGLWCMTESGHVDGAGEQDPPAAGACGPQGLSAKGGHHRKDATQAAHDSARTPDV